MYSIESCSIDDIRLNPQNYNSNNHWIDSIMPDDYKETNEKTNSEFWLPKFKDKYVVVTFSSSEVALLKSMMDLCRLKNEISLIHKEDIDDIVKKYAGIDELLKEGKFVRTENVSLKYGKNGIGPYTNLFKVIESILTSPDGHCPLYPTSTSLKLYILPWISINKFREFRVFVCNNKLTAISQQHLYESNELLKSLDEEHKMCTIIQWIDIIVGYFNDVIKSTITHVSSYVYDFAILDDNSPYFIEINPFGKEYSSGSSLFHWILDEDELYGKTDFIYFRYTS